MERYEEAAFAVSNFRQVNYGKIRLTFDLRIGPVVLRECVIVVDDAGKPKFAAARRVKEKFSDAWISVAELDSRFMRRVFSDVVAKLEQPKQTPERNDDPWAENQETRFERAFDEIDGAR